MAPFESALGRDFATLLEFDDAVVRFEAQPLEIRYVVDGLMRKGVPDFLVTFVDARQMLCDVKYRDEIFRNWHELKPRLRAAMSHARSANMIYHIYSDVEIRTSFLRNARFLLPYRRKPHAMADEAPLLETLNRLRKATPGELLLHASLDEQRRAELVPCLWALIGRRLIGADLSNPLSMAMSIECV